MNQLRDLFWITYALGSSYRKSSKRALWTNPWDKELFKWISNQMKTECEDQENEAHTMINSSIMKVNTLAWKYRKDSLGYVLVPKDVWRMIISNDKPVKWAGKWRPYHHEKVNNGSGKNSMKRKERILSERVLLGLFYTLWSNWESSSGWPTVGGPHTVGHPKELPQLIHEVKNDTSESLLKWQTNGKNKKMNLIPW